MKKILLGNETLNTTNWSDLIVNNTYMALTKVNVVVVIRLERFINQFLFPIAPGATLTHFVPNSTCSRARMEKLKFSFT